MTDPAGQIALMQNYDPFGNPTQIVGSPPSVFGYTGEQTDSTGLVFLRARYYNARVGRFLTADSLIPDPLRSIGWNRYAYANNNPILYVDPSGHCQGLSGAAFDACAALVLATAPAVHKLNDYREDIFFPGPNTTFANRLEASTVVGVSSVVVAAIALKAWEAVLTTEEAYDAVQQCYEPKSDEPLPPGWNENWRRGYGTRQDSETERWFDENGGEWRWHAPDKWHPEGHWDYNPWTEWNSPWQNLDEFGNPMPKSPPGL